MERYVTIDQTLLHFDLPEAVQARLQFLLDKQDQGGMLAEGEKREAQGLVELSEFLTLLRLKVKRTID